MRYAMIAIALITLCTAATNGYASDVRVVEIQGPIGPAVSDYFVRALTESQDADAVLMLLDTPGGLDQSMRDMIKAILASRVPVIAYVYPGGSHAASAGTYLVYASHVAAMAPATNIGSSTPVQIGGTSPFPRDNPLPIDPPAQEDFSEPANGTAAERPESTDAMQSKIVNDAVAYLRSLAELRGRNADWAEQSVRTGANLSAGAALSEGVIDLMAEDISTLLAKANGRVVTVVSGQELTLQLTDVTLTNIPLGWRHQFLSLITNPNLAYLLLIIGLYGLIIEFYNPGVGVAGFVGVVCLLLGGFAFQMLPVNYVGMALILFGIGMMVAEALTPSLGLLGLGGVAVFVLGSILLMDSNVPGYRISLALIAILAVTSAAIFSLAIGAAIKARRRPAVTGQSALFRQKAIATEDFAGDGHVRVLGEIWLARSAVPIVEGQALSIVGIEGLTLAVQPLEN